MEQTALFLKPEEILKQIGIRRGMQVADLGCGTGYMSFIVARMIGDKGRVYAVDVQKVVLEQVLREARAENILNLETVWSDLEIIGATRVPAGAMDLVLLVNVLFQIADQGPVFGEARRLLKPGGLCLVVDWLPGDSSIGPPPEKRLTEEIISKQAAEAGFSEPRPINAGQYHFGLLFKG